jgi:DNA end-binding protein Ku
MASRSVWSGHIRFGLVSVPVKAYTATASGGNTSLNQLHKGCNSRIQYKKSCPVHGEVKADEIVSGYEYAKDQYVVIDPAEIEKLRTENEKAIDVKAFIPPDVIDARYYSGKTWYLLPDGPVGLKPYALLYKTMEDQDLMAFAQVVVGGKEQLILLRPISNVLVGSYLNFSSEVKPMSEFSDQSPRVEVAPDELKMAKMLTDAMKVADFDLAQYKDDYAEKLTQLVQAKVEGREVVTPPAEEAPHLVNLMEALKKSVDQAKRQTAAGGRPPKISVPSVGTEARSPRKRKSS